MDLYNHQRNYERYLERIKDSKDISRENKTIMFNFRDYLLSEGISIQRIYRYFSDLIKYDRILRKPFNQAKKEDIRKVLAEINQTKLSEESKKSFKILLRKLYKFISGIDEKGVYPEEVRWISISIPNNHKKMPEELLTEEEVMKIIENCNNLRDKTLICCLYESGCRVSEIGTMKIKHISIEQHGARLTVKGKTGMRKILVINSTPYLQEWINHHPSNKDKESYLWVSRYNKILSYNGIKSILKKAVNRAGIKKRVYLHLLRHSRATFLASTPGMSDSAMKYYFGWTQGSKMATTYIHMSGKDTDRAILMANGIKSEEENKDSKIKPKPCLRCKTSNEVTNRFCKICGFILDKEEANRIIKEEFKRNQADEIMNRLINDSEILELIKKKLESNP